MSTEQRENLEAILRQSAFPAGSDVGEQRRLLRGLTSAQPLPADVTVTAAALGGVPTAEITVDGIEPRHALGLISPIFADLSGLPPLIIQAGTHEVLLDDAVRLAQQAATADVEVTLDITPRVPHVFQTFYPILDEAAAALDRAGQFLSAHRRCRTRHRRAKGRTQTVLITQRSRAPGNRLRASKSQCLLAREFAVGSRS